MKSYGKIFQYAVIAILLYIPQSYSQFDSSLLFHKWGLHAPFYSATYMGDQNRDGCDDFLVTIQDPTEINNQYYNFYSTLYYGSRTKIDTTGKFSIKSFGWEPAIGSMDINGDGYRDIICLKDFSAPLRLTVYYGGPSMDTIPDMTINIPYFDEVYELKILNSNGFRLDFDGDGKEDLAVAVWGHRFGLGYQWGNVLIYQPYITPMPQPAEVTKINATSGESLQWTYNYISVADLDGDGKTDVRCNVYNPDSHRSGYKIFYGDSNLQFNNFYTLHDWFALSKVFPDMNNDGKGEFQFPPWDGSGWNYSLTNGANPPDTITGYKYQVIGSRDIAPVGDVNGDGYNDLIFIGGPLSSRDQECAFLFGTAPGQPFKENLDYGVRYMLQERGINSYGRIGDINGDGCEDVVLIEGVHLNNNINNYGFCNIYGGKRVCTSVKEENSIKTEELELACYPNPTTGELKVVYSLPQNVNNAFLSVYDMLGKEIKHIELLPSIGKKEASINLKEENISSGVYIANIRYHEKGELKNKAIKIQYIK